MLNKGIATFAHLTPIRRQAQPEHNLEPIIINHHSCLLQIFRAWVSDAVLIDGEQAVTLW